MQIGNEFQSTKAGNQNKLDNDITNSASGDNDATSENIENLSTSKMAKAKNSNLAKFKKSDLAKI